ncbi:hypothetical protein PF005_g2747 [Phytophthora fragariae]|uniref:Uncharacterized protein n=1 Tax=Phytophthora fragariae TaxID=53985 RepID=A0A6A3G163_9STRA|nr:hypothetical protein PF003_g20048 [Phytophthora fragariae]KAE8947678.1 hypothetical protein PF009_g2747 [Phytophthora fragariae]KAE9027254.1 hypothetical protein PF011_g2145 [Phytophthora fragariae]KAE9135163.1 hypothetical protein PF010_g2185 [Phytophthora fragariae]KAE9135395.1 hypothetical protein PF007_g2575 [Phytophthora fragariae]
MELLLAAARTSFDGSSGGQEGDLAAREIHEIQQCQYAERSVEKYRSLMVRYLRWVVENKPELATETFTTSLKLDKSDSPTKKSILATFDSAPASPPLHFANLEPDGFLKWVHSRKNQ